MDEPELGKNGSRFRNALLRPIRAEMFAIPGPGEFKHPRHPQRVLDRRPGLADRLRADVDALVFTVFWYASVTASPRVSSSTEANRTLVDPARPHAPLSGSNASG